MKNLSLLERCERSHDGKNMPTQARSLKRPFRVQSSGTIRAFISKEAVQPFRKYLIFQATKKNPETYLDLENRNFTEETEMISLQLQWFK
jgi:hypothetical protein